MKKLQTEYTEADVSHMIDTFLSNTKFQNGLNNLIINTLSNRKTVSQARKKVIDRINGSDFVKASENELIDKILKTLGIEGSKERELIQVKEKKVKKPTKHLSSTNFDSPKLLNYLFDEFLTSDDDTKIESYLGEMSNFDIRMIEENSKITECLEKVAQFVARKQSETMIANVINLFTVLSRTSDLIILVRVIEIQLSFLKHHVTKFYKNNFDISNFYKINLNLECLNKVMTKLYGNSFILKRIDPSRWKQIISNLLEILLINYTMDNPIYFGEAKKNAFGLSTNYIILLLFCLDEDLCLFKILARNYVTRHILFDQYDQLKPLVFTNLADAKESFGEKYCFLWKHTSVLDQIYSNVKMGKKYLVYAWLSIKINLLGIFLRHKTFREKFYNGDLTVVRHFKEVVEFLIEDVMENTNKTLDLDESMKENLFYLLKEIGCDFILYCDKPVDLEEMHSFLINMKDRVRKMTDSKMVVALFEDFLLAFKENLHSSSLIDTIDYNLN